MSEYHMLVPKETFQKYNRLEPVDLTSACIRFVLKKIFHVRTQNNITAPSMSNM